MVGQPSPSMPRLTNNLCPLLAGLVVAAAGRPCAATEQISLLHDRAPAAIAGEPVEDLTGFWERFQDALDQRMDEVYSDRLHPVSVLGWSVKRPGDSWAQWRERTDHGVESAFVKSVEYSLRDAAVVLPFIGGLASGEDSFGDLFLDSVDAVEEEAVSPLDPLYRPAERLWWKDLAQKRELRYGLRPFRPDPYAFVSLRVTEADRLLLLGHLRYYYRGFADHRFEVALSLPVANGLTVDVGTAYQFGQHDEQKKLVVKLFKPLKQGGILHVGVEVQKHPTLFAALSLPM
jgi:hypothetical protein